MQHVATFDCDAFHAVRMDVPVRGGRSYRLTAGRNAPATVGARGTAAHLGGHADPLQSVDDLRPHRRLRHALHALMNSGQRRNPLVYHRHVQHRPVNCYSRKCGQVSSAATVAHLETGVHGEVLLSRQQVQQRVHLRGIMQDQSSQWACQCSQANHRQQVAPATMLTAETEMQSATAEARLHRTRSA